jgi:hypothetical protein
VPFEQRGEVGHVELAGRDGEHNRFRFEGRCAGSPGPSPHASADRPGVEVEQRAPAGVRRVDVVQEIRETKAAAER